MKKYFYLILILSFSILIQVSMKTYAYKENCADMLDHPKNLSSQDLNNYIKNKFGEVSVNYFCSYNKCHYIKNSDMDNEVNNYLKIQESNGMTDYVIEAKVKGFPITKISVNQCD